jgi:hypothetical protein
VVNPQTQVVQIALLETVRREDEHFFALGLHGMSPDVTRPFALAALTSAASKSCWNGVRQCAAGS